MSKDLLSNIFQEVKDKGVIDDEFIKYLDGLFSDKSASILDVVQRGFIKYTYNPSMKVVWCVPAKKRPEEEYFIYPKIYCSCRDFYKAVVLERTRSFCKHILAQVICEALQSYKSVELNDKSFKKRIAELKQKFK
jgi:predicted nucleic acid-binding Zn finger protein